MAVGSKSISISSVASSKTRELFEISSSEYLADLCTDQCWFKPVSRGLQLRLVCILLIDSFLCSKYRIVIETARLVRHVIA